MNLKPESVPAQVMQKQEFQVTSDKRLPEQDDTRQADAITTALEGKASASTSPLQRGGQTQDDAMRRTTSSNISIGPKESSLLEEEASLQQNESLKAVLEQPQTGEQALTGAPEVQQMTGGVSGSSGFNPQGSLGASSSIRKRPALAVEPANPLTLKPPVGSKGLGGAQTPLQRPREYESGHVGSLSERSGGSGQHSKRENCSPCSEPIVNCCQNLFGGRMSIAGRSTTLPAQRMASFPRSTTRPSISTFALEDSEHPISQWERLTINQLYDEFICPENESSEDDIMTEIERREEKQVTEMERKKGKQEGQQKRAEKVARKRSLEIDLILKINRCSLGEDEIDADYRAVDYEEVVPWQKRLLTGGSTRLKPTSMDSYANMTSHDNDITSETVASLKKELNACPPKTRDVLEKGQARALEVARKKDHLRVLPVIFDEGCRTQNVHNIATLLKSSGKELFFSADKEVVSLVKEAYTEAGEAWPSAADSPITTSLSRNLFSIGKDNLTPSAITPQEKDLCRVSKNVNKRNLRRPLQVIKESIDRKGKNFVGMLFVEQDTTHIGQDFEVYNEDGVYLGIMDKNTMLLHAESMPYTDRFAVKGKL